LGTALDIAAAATAGIDRPAAMIGPRKAAD
jgi:hypothetical protein